MQLQHLEYELDDSLERFDFERCHAWLSAAYWSSGIPHLEVERGFRCSTLVAGHLAGAQIGCARVVSDRTRFAYLMDVYVDARHRARGLGQALVRFFLEHPELTLVYKWTLATADAHGVYQKLGFAAVESSEAASSMVLKRPRPWMKPE